MSLSSKIALGLSFGFSVGVIYFVQSKQQDDIKKMHDGVIRDKERQFKKRTENIYMLQQQAELEKLLRKQTTDNEAVEKLLQTEKED